MAPKEVGIPMLFSMGSERLRKLLYSIHFWINIWEKLKKIIKMIRKVKKKTMMNHQKKRRKKRRRMRKRKLLTRASSITITKKADSRY